MYNIKMSEIYDTHSIPIWVEYIVLLTGLFQMNKGHVQNVVKVIAFLIFVAYFSATTFFVMYQNDKTFKSLINQEGVFRFSYLFCRLIEFSHTLTKLIRYRTKSEKIDKLMQRIRLENKDITIYDTRHKFKYLNNIVILLLSLATIIVESIYTAAFKGVLTIVWVYPVLFNLSEYYFIHEINRNTKEKFEEINIRFEIIKKLKEEIPRVKRRNIEREIEEDIFYVTQLSKKHYNLVELTREISETFSYSVGGSLSIGIANIVSAFYMLLIHPSALNHFKIISRCLLWVTLHVYSSVAIVNTWNSLRIEANKTASILHDIWNEHTVKNGINKKLNYLQFISLRFWNTKLNFTAHGFFPIDLTFLHSILATVATYVIILVQLKHLN